MSHTTQAIIILIGTPILVTTMIIIVETYGVKRYLYLVVHWVKAVASQSQTSNNGHFARLVAPVI
ncbi:hypothetical protein KDW_39800 [Dictyobacter vulcani]|uniref:Uncharacterized protein n=1 Tax=Dictyobacter vulcani TaxID=2607529 RepID=A0A5J4KJC5_9CHLR|nr:hypothetical protein [Dictyobacter vulcani]GER89818.1 hypothetical protein KDW_39800 [Dictyobacter vulcani]